MRWLLLVAAIALLAWLGSLMWHTFFLGQY
jgi:hypothetical protein